MGVVRYRTAALLRRHWRATLAMAVMAGLVGGVVLATWSAGRRGRDAYDGFVRYVDYPQANMWLCSPQTTKAQAVAASGLCPVSYDATAERDFVAGLPQVESVSITRFYPVRITVAGQTFSAAISSTVGGDLLSAAGTPIVAQGHLPKAVGDLAVNEVSVKSVGAAIHLGEPVTIQPLDFRTYQPLPISPEQLHLRAIVRFPQDLAASLRDPTAADGVAFVSTAWFERYGRSLPVFGNEIQARLRPGAKAEDVYRAVEAQWPGRYINTLDSHDATAATVKTAIGYESTALNALAAALAIAALIFLGQALGRQTRREQADLPALRGLGLSRGQGVASAALRAVPVAVGAALIAVVVAWISSAWTPIGLARKAASHFGPRVDLGAFLVGGSVIFLVTLACLVTPSWWRRRSSSRGAVAGSRMASSLGLPPPGVTGVAMATSRRRGSLSLGLALAGLAVGTAVVVAAATVAFSLRRLGDDGWRYGTRWDATISFNGGNGDQAVAAAQRLSGISQAGVIREQDGRVDGRPLNVVSVEGVKGSEAAAWTAVVDGRAPQTDAEAALGGKSMRELHVRLGDTVTLQVSDAVAPRRLKVVGQVELNDGGRLDTGDGVLVLPAVLAPVRNTSFDALAVRLRPGSSPQEVLAPLAAMGGDVRGPTPSASVRNLERIRWLPWALATAVAVLAIGALGYALGTSVRSNRREFSILRSLGFTPRQVRRAAQWEGLAVAVGAVAAGVPLGLAFGAWGWSRLMADVGIVDRASVPPMALVVVPLAVTAVALLLSVRPGRHAAALPPAAALRAE